MLLLVLALVLPGTAFASNTRTYEVTIENLSTGQPLSPAVVATHRPGLKMFRLHRHASPEIEAIA